MEHARAFSASSQHGEGSAVNRMGGLKSDAASPSKVDAMGEGQFLAEPAP